MNFFFNRCFVHSNYKNEQRAYHFVPLSFFESGFINLPLVLNFIIYKVLEQHETHQGVPVDGFKGIKNMLLACMQGALLNIL